MVEQTTACMHPSKYLIDLYNPSWDKPLGELFQTTFGGFSMQQCAWIAYKTKAIATINDGIITKYGLDPCSKGSEDLSFADCNGFRWVLLVVTSMLPLSGQRVKPLVMSNKLEKTKIHM